MGFLGSLFGAGLGWWLGGPVGAVLGLIFGYVTEERGSVQSGKGDQRQNRDGFLASLLILVAAIMKADGKVLRSELDYVRIALERSLGSEKAAQAVLALRDILKQDFSVQDIALQIRVNLDYSARLELLHLLFGVARADGAVSMVELQLIQSVASQMGISNGDLQSIQNMFVDNLESAYKVLEVTSEVSDEDLKKAYRKMAMRFHPDKVSHLGPEFQESANEKFRKVNESYEKIKLSRGLK